MSIESIECCADSLGDVRVFRDDTFLVNPRAATARDVGSLFAAAGESKPQDVASFAERLRSFIAAGFQDALNSRKA